MKSKNNTKRFLVSLDEDIYRELRKGLIDDDKTVSQWFRDQVDKYLGKKK